MEEGRRGFLRSGWDWVRVAAVAVLLYPLLRFVGFAVPKKPRLVRVEKLMKPGDVHLDPEFALFRDDKGAWAVSRTCTHLGCRLNYSEKEHQLICPCHQSKFTPQGERVDGPATKNLPLFPVETLSDPQKSGYIVSL